MLMLPMLSADAADRHDDAWMLEMLISSYSDETTIALKTI